MIVRLLDRAVLPLHPWASSISRKTQGAVILALLLILGILYLVLRLVVLSSFDTVERRYAGQTIATATRAIEDQLGLLSRSVVDYAVWDDTYAFIKGEHDTYVASNFTDGMFESNQLDLVIIADNSGAVAFQRILGPAGDLDPADQARVVASVQASGAIAAASDEEPRAMVLLTPQWPLMISTHRVLHSDGSGPSDGVFVMGRWIDDELTTELSKRLQTTLAIYRLDRPLPDHLPAAARALIQAPTGSITVPTDDQHLGSYWVIGGGDGQPLALSELISDRPIFAAGQRTIVVTLSIIILVGLLFVFSISVLLDRLVLARLRQLSEGVHTIGAQPDLSGRVALAGSDELSQLAATINRTMEALQWADNERRRAEQQREAMWQETVRARRAFIAMISHELRTPLTPIRGYTDMMLHGAAGEIDPEQHQFLTAIMENTQRMEATVNDLLVVGQLEAGHIEIEPEPLLVADLVHSVRSMFEEAISKKVLSISVDISSDLPLICADKHRVDQILANLLSNAVKYTPQGGAIRVSAGMVDEDFLEIAISDTGIGVSAEDQERLFTPFYRTDRAVHSQIPGTGLGLSIVRSLVLLHGGTIQVSSAPDQGSTFRFTLPVYSRTATPASVEVAGRQASTLTS